MKRLQRRNLFGILVIAAAVIICISVFASDKTVTLRFCSLTSDKTCDITVQPEDMLTVDGNILVPLRTLCDGIGASLDWNDELDYAFVTLNASYENNAENMCDDLLTSEKSADSNVKNKAVRVFIPTDSCNARVYYDYTDENGETVSFEKSYQWYVGARIFSDVSYVPVRCFAESFGFEVKWDEKAHTISISVPEEDSAAVPVLSIASDKIAAPAATATPFFINDDVVEITQAPASMIYTASDNYTIGEYLGRFKITHYCTCSICNGGYGNSTAFGGRIRPGITIAVDPSVIKKLSWVYIDGYGVRFAEDVGGAIKGNHIDMAVPDHNTAMAMGVRYCDVWYAAVPDSEISKISSGTISVSNDLVPSPSPTESAAPSEEPEKSEEPDSPKALPSEETSPEPTDVPHKE